MAKKTDFVFAMLMLTLIIENLYAGMADSSKHTELFFSLRGRINRNYYNPSGKEYVAKIRENYYADIDRRTESINRWVEIRCHRQQGKGTSSGEDIKIL